MLAKYRKLQPKPKMTDELKVALQTICEELSQEHVNKEVIILPSDWLPTWLWLSMMVTPSICSNSVCMQVCILISSPTNRLFSETPTDYRWRQRSECWEMEGCLGRNRRKQHNFFFIFGYISTKLVSRVCILCFNSCVEFHAKIWRNSWNINKS